MKDFILNYSWLGLLFVIIAIFSLILTGCGEDVGTIPQEMIGTWKLDYQTTPNKDKIYYIYELTLVLNEDRSCNQKGYLRIRYQNQEGGSSLGINYSGKYMVNKNGTKFKIDVEENSKSFQTYFKEYTDFHINGNELTIGDWTYKKVN